MRIGKLIQGCAVVLATFGILLPRVAVAEQPQAPVVRDVALEQGGVLAGQVLDEQGVALANVQVAIGQNGAPMMRTSSDADGRFQFAGLRGGVYEVQTPQSVGVYRLWAPNTAPPSAQNAVMMVNGQGVVRGQIATWFANPWFLAGLIALAIAIPLALDDDDSGS